MVHKSTIAKVWEYGALIIMAYALSLAVARLLPSPMENSRGVRLSTPVRMASEADQDSRDFDKILSRNVFGLISPERSQQQSLTAMPVASLNIRLLGTIYADAPILRRAVIMLQNKKQIIKEIGDTVENSTIKDIRRRGIVLEHAGKTQLLLMERNDAAIAEQSGKKKTHALLSGANISRGLRMTTAPNREGILVQRLDKSNPLALLGLLAGDILTGIDDTALTTPPTGQRMAQLLNRKNVRIFLLRDNKPHIVHVSLQR